MTVGSSQSSWVHCVSGLVTPTSHILHHLVQISLTFINDNNETTSIVKDVIALLINTNVVLLPCYNQFIIIVNTN